jgi:hypothetical protein
MEHPVGSVTFSVRHQQPREQADARLLQLCLSGPGINNPITAADAGDGFLMRLGYTVVDAGWQVTSKAGRKW